MKRQVYLRFILLLAATVIFQTQTADACGGGLPGGGGIDCLSGATEVFVGVRGIQRVPNWDQACGPNPGDDFWNPFGGQVNITDLVGSPYSFRQNGNPWSWWIEAGGGDFSNCFDDDTDPPGGFQCLEGSTIFANCPITIWVQLVGECDDCINNQLGGTWFKGSVTIDPFQIGTVCGTQGENSAFLALQPRTNCNDANYEWGCGPGEFQD